MTDEARYQNILLEEMRSNFNLLHEKLLTHDAKFDRIERKLEAHDLRFETIDAKIFILDKKVSDLDKKLSHLDVRTDNRLGRIEKHLGLNGHARKPLAKKKTRK